MVGIILAFNFSIIRQTILGDLRLIIGNFILSEGDSSGTVDLSRYLHSITHVSLQLLGSSVVADAPAINEQLIGLPPRIDKATFEIKTTANAKGIFFATGL